MRDTNSHRTREAPAGLNWFRYRGVLRVAALVLGTAALMARNVNSREVPVLMVLLSDRHRLAGDGVGLEDLQASRVARSPTAHVSADVGWQ
ncbi:hypothetical protein Rhow_002323 [Rhodococcus wratislaviensis]|uniref:Uncharacterized protein n=1 Tax=Rhodococcus wratislaviensis TaxID=44752 RepID=A0A402C5C8_RHOWR|nr:hypothetical protein Rhow_002323 [Rhodococcus wratislaviensis]